MKEGETMIRTQKIAIMLVVLLGLSAMLAVIISSYQTSQFMGFPFVPREGFRINPGDLELYYMVQTVLSTVNIVLTAVLIFNYAGIYAKTKSEFTLGLLLFALMLLIKDVASSPFIIGLGGFSMFGLGPFAFLPGLFEMAALLVLFYLSVRY
jgi:uncharacterized membrane protein